MPAIRGLHTHQQTLYGVCESVLFRMDSSGAITPLATLASTGGPLDFASMLGQLVITDGSYLYVWDGVSLRSAADYPGGERIAFIDQRIVFDIRETQRFGWTALGDATSIGGLDFASAESAADNLRAVVATNDEIWLFGDYTTEPWRSVGGEAVFQSTGNTLEYGCAAPHAIRKAANTITWLARDQRGQATVLSAVGYQPQRVSTRAIEERFEGRDLFNASAYTYSDGGQAFYCLNVPGLETTLVYDHAFKQWHERAEWRGGRLRPWRPTAHAFAYGRHWFGDAEGRIYMLDADTHTFAGDPKARIRITPAVANPARQCMRFTHLELLCERASNATVMMRYGLPETIESAQWHYSSAGATGHYAQRVRWNRLGSGHDRVFEIRVTDDAPFNPIAADVGIV